jgi:hypothetical protein
MWPYLKIANIDIKINEMIQDDNLKNINNFKNNKKIKY